MRLATDTTVINQPKGGRGNRDFSSKGAIKIGSPESVPILGIKVPDKRQNGKPRYLFVDMTDLARAILDKACLKTRYEGAEDISAKVQCCTSGEGVLVTGPLRTQEFFDHLVEAVRNASEDRARIAFTAYRQQGRDNFVCVGMFESAPEMAEAKAA